MSKFIFHNIAFNLDNVVIYGFLLLGFTILLVTTTKKALTVQIDRKEMETPEFFFDRYARMGWACVVLHFLSLYTLSHQTYFYYPFALVAYILLTLKEQAGVFLLTVFYVFSISRMFTSTINVFYGIQKVLSMLYVLGYSYIFTQRYLQRKRIERQEKEKST